MSVRHSLFAAAIVSCVALALSPASGQTLRYANQGELKSLDPYTLKETTTIAHHAHIYEGLVTRDKNLKMVPALAATEDERAAALIGEARKLLALYIAEVLAR